jgi:hypothetical protein
MSLVRINVTLPAPRPQPDRDYASNLLAAAVHAGQSKLHLKRALLAAPRNHRHILQRLSEAEQLAILVIQRLRREYWQPSCWTVSASTVFCQS